MGCTGTAVLVLLFFSAGLSDAQIQYNTFWNASAGITPDEVNPPWPSDTNAGTVSYSAGNPLILTAPAIGNHIFYSQSPATGLGPPVTEIQATLKVDSSTSSGNARAGTYILFGNPASIGNGLYLGDNIIFLLSPTDPTGNTRGPSVGVDTVSAFHTYRIEVDGTNAGSAVTVYYDGAAVLTGTTFLDVDQAPEILFGEGGIYASGVSEWLSIEQNAGPGPTNQISIPTNGLVSWWQGENNTLDSVSGNNGTLESGATYAPGRIGYAFEFNGSIGAVNLGEPAAFDWGPGDSFTISAWFDCFGLNADMSNGAQNDGQVIVCMNYGCGNPLSGQVLAINRTGTNVSWLVRDLSDNSAQLVYPTASLFNTFHHLVGVRDTAHTNVLLYLDGVLVSAQGDPTTAMLSNETVPDLIGRRNACASYNNFNGLIDDVMIYNRALSASEVAALYNYGSQIYLSASQSNNVSLTATGVAPNQTVVYLSTTNLLSNWAPFQTNIGDGGALTLTNLFNLNYTSQFFRAAVP